ncbi:Potassium voltage-gated channel protein eag [Melipona quadrifasciata]|uniref:Potassium voltage-gated channel protein eag n=1 Tax=Melipona quadrifasciata TaxID=166423 RepID=A0A0M8ZYX9_9HYME|nr:Potassium voltage-gated channel protein eag [Melipona quadrifasciata]
MQENTRCKEMSREFEKTINSHGLAKLIFRKVADVRREKELAERRKNEPQLDQAQDHLVRKIFSRFKTDGEAQIGVSRAANGRSQQDSDEELTVNVLPPWPSFRQFHFLRGVSLDDQDNEKKSTRVAARINEIRSLELPFRRERHNADVEKGDGKDGKEGKEGESSHTRKLSTTEENTAVKGRAGKWGRLLGSSSLDSGSETGTGVDTFKRSLSARDARPSSSASSNKVFPKFGKLTGTIEESGDAENAKDAQQQQQQQQQQQTVADSKQLQLRRLESYDDGLITTQPSHDREILAAVLEVKVDLKLEVQRVNQRLAKIGYREQGTTTERSSKSQEHHHHHHHHHQSQQSDRLKDSSDYKTSSREVSKELLERLAQASTSRGDDSTPLGPLILRKRRSKSRNKGAAPLAPLASQPISPSEATETTQMLECTDDREPSATATDRSDRSDRKRPPPRPREYLIEVAKLSNEKELVRKPCSRRCLSKLLTKSSRSYFAMHPNGLEKKKNGLIEGAQDRSASTTAQKKKPPRDEDI